MARAMSHRDVERRARETFELIDPASS